jgi:antitoxin Phd
MDQAQWQLQTAKAQLSELIEAALQGQPQRITRRGKDAVMVLSESAYLSMKRNGSKQAPDFIAHLLAIPKAESKLTPEQVNPAFAQELEQWLETLLSFYRERILPVAATEARVWGRLSSRLGNEGADILIAATAITNRRENL